MTQKPLKIADLPVEIPVFPLPRTILLPRVMLPLNIFEPRYLAMVDAAISSHRMIGMIQPREEAQDPSPLFKMGCLGKIISFTETEDGRYVITLKGICRFDVEEELSLKDGYRRMRVDYRSHVLDLSPDLASEVCRESLSRSLKSYLEKMNMVCDKWEDIRDMGCEKLISTLSVVCPFETAEKQALLEARTTDTRAEILKALCALGAEPQSCGRAH